MGPRPSMHSLSIAPMCQRTPMHPHAPMHPCACRASLLTASLWWLGALHPGPGWSWQLLPQSMQALQGSSGPHWQHWPALMTPRSGACVSTGVGACLYGLLGGWSACRISARIPIEVSEAPSKHRTGRNPIPMETVEKLLRRVID